MASLSEILAVEFTAPKTVMVIREIQENPSSSPRRRQDAQLAHLETRYSAISPGTELLVYNGTMPNDIPLDKLFSSQAHPFRYPCRYGYAVVAVVTCDDSGTHPTGTRVFAFREHVSQFDEAPHSLLVIPNDISSLDAVFLPNVETAVSLATDAALLPGEAICVVGQGIVGLLLVSALRLLYPYSKVITIDVNPARRKLSTGSAGAQGSLDPCSPSFLTSVREALGDGADVSVDVSGAGEGLQTAIDVTRDHGRVVIGSWFGSNHVTLPRLGGRFHRSHVSLIASQVSEIPPHLTGRWTKSRRLALTWRLLRDIRPSTKFPVHIAKVEDASQVYRDVAESRHLQVVFAYGNSPSTRDSSADIRGL